MREPLIEHRMEFAGVDTRVLELEGDGPPIILFHGFSDSADTWRHTLALLSVRGRRAIAVDLPGFGTATRLRREAILPQLVAFGSAVVDHAADAVGGGDVVVAGNSLGGCLSLLLAERPELPIRGIVPVAPAGLDMARWFVLLERDPIVRTLLAMPVPLPQGVVRGAVGAVYRQLAFAEPRHASREVVAAFTQHFPDRATVARYLAVGKALLPELRDPFQLSRIGCPVLLVWGTRDRLVFRTGAERVLQTVAESRLEVIEDCGHCPQLERPELFATMLAQFPERMAQRAA